LREPKSIFFVYQLLFVYVTKIEQIGFN